MQIFIFFCRNENNNYLWGIKSAHVRLSVVDTISVLMRGSKLKGYFMERILPRFVILLLDILILIFSFFSVFLIYNGISDVPDHSWKSVITFCVVLVFFNTFSFLLFRTYRGVLRFSSFHDLLRVTLSLTIGYLLSFLVLHVIHRGQAISHYHYYHYLLFIAIFFVNLCLMILSRVVVKEGYEYIIGKSKTTIRVFIYGTKSAGMSLAKALKSGIDLNYKVEGFVSDDPMMIGKGLLGLPVHAFDEQLFHTMRLKDVHTILVSPLKMEEVKYSDKLTRLVDNDIAIRTIPHCRVSDSQSLGEQIKERYIEDLSPIAHQAEYENVVSSIEKDFIRGRRGGIDRERRSCATGEFNLLPFVRPGRDALHELELN